MAIQPGKHCLICTGDGCLPDDFLSDLKLSLAEKAELRKATPRAEQLAINGNYDSDKESGEESDEDDRKTRPDRESERSRTVCRILGLVKYSSCVLPSRRLIRYLWAGHRFDIVLGGQVWKSEEALMHVVEIFVRGLWAGPSIK